MGRFASGLFGLGLGALAAAALLGACSVDPPGVDGDFACTTDDHCTEGFTCVAGFCRDGVPRDAGSERDAGASVDAGASDAGAPRDGGALDSGPHDGGARDSGPRDGGACALTVCGVECVDTQANAMHCGGCGVDCGGGACSDGECQAFVWQDLPGQRPTRVATDGVDLYWTIEASQGAVMRRALDRSTPAQPIALNQPYPDRLVLSDDYVAWTALDQNTGARPGHIRYRDKALASATVEVTTATQRSPDGLAIHDDRIVWTVDSPLYLRAHTIGGAVDSYDELQFSGGSSYAQAMVADATYAYWFDSQANVFRVPLTLTGATPEPVAIDQEEEPKSAVLFGDWLYYGDGANGLMNDGWLRRTNKATFVTETIAAHANPDDAEHGVFELATDGATLFYTTESSGGRHGRVFSVPVTGGTPTPIATLTDAPNAAARGVATAGGFVYWAEWRSSGSVAGRLMARRVD